jgi:hypothetical protein
VLLLLEVLWVADLLGDPLLLLLVVPQVLREVLEVVVPEVVVLVVHSFWLIRKITLGRGAKTNAIVSTQARVTLSTS